MNKFMLGLLFSGALVSSSNASFFSDEDNQTFSHMRAQMNSPEGQAQFANLRQGLNRGILEPNGFFDQAHRALTQNLSPEKKEIFDRLHERQKQRARQGLNVEQNNLSQRVAPSQPQRPEVNLRQQEESVRLSEIQALREREQSQQRELEELRRAERIRQEEIERRRITEANAAYNQPPIPNSHVDGAAAPNLEDLG